jgi:hypothetical protein
VFSVMLAKCVTCLQVIATCIHEELCGDLRYKCVEVLQFTANSSSAAFQPYACFNAFAYGQAPGGKDVEL